VQSQLLRRWRHEDGGFKASPGKGSETLSQKQNFNKRAGGVTQVVALVWHAVRPWVQSPIPPKKKSCICVENPAGWLTSWLWRDGMLQFESQNYLGLSLAPSHTFFFFLPYWGLNSGTMPWATLPALFGEGFFLDRVSQNYLPWLALNQDPPDLFLLSSLSTDMSHHPHYPLL
jgi:hypothetical protein